MSNQVSTIWFDSKTQGRFTLFKRDDQVSSSTYYGGCVFLPLKDEAYGGSIFLSTYSSSRTHEWCYSTNTSVTILETYNTCNSLYYLTGTANIDYAAPIYAGINETFSQSYDANIASLTEVQESQLATKTSIYYGSRTLDNSTGSFRAYQDKGMILTFEYADGDSQSISYSQSRSRRLKYETKSTYYVYPGKVTGSYSAAMYFNACPVLDNRIVAMQVGHITESESLPCKQWFKELITGDYASASRTAGVMSLISSFNLICSTVAHSSTDGLLNSTTYQNESILNEDNLYGSDIAENCYIGYGNQSYTAYSTSRLTSYLNMRGRYDANIWEWFIRQKDGINSEEMPNAIAVSVATVYH